MSRAGQVENSAKRDIIPRVRELGHRNLRFFVLFVVAALGLRLFFILRFPGVVTDSFIYGDIAKNWLQHGIYGLSGPDEISPTYIRLPGYPAFLAFIFAIFGIEHYRTVLLAQMFVDIGTCFLCADIALRLIGPRTARIAFVLAALCPFLANYSAAALTETQEEFVPMGFNLWVKTWIADYVSVEEIYWPVPGSPIEAERLPSRAFDTERQQEETAELIADYNSILHVSPLLDKRFETLASARIRVHPARYYFWLPLSRIADTRLRPRTEMLPCDSRWWEFNDEPRWSALAISLGAINLFYLLCSVVGVMRSRTSEL